LYDEARRLVGAGNYGEACPKFKTSYELDPGGGTLLNLADCYDKEGKTALAWTTFKEALVAAQRDGHSDRIDFANRRIASLESRLARLTVSISAGARVRGLSVTVDGMPLADAAWDVAMPVDPGKHIVRAEAPGKRPFETSIEVDRSSSGRRTVEVPPLADGPIAEGGSPRTVPAAASSESAALPAEHPATSAPNSRATLGWVIGAVGLASVGLGSYFGLTAFSKWSDRNTGCAHGCTTDAKQAGDDANTAATISDIGFGVGIAALATGAVLVLSGNAAKPVQHEAAVRVAPRTLSRGAGLWVEGEW
jgi:hypothetical protein